MRLDENHFDQLLQRTFEADTAGVFSQTPVDAAGLIERASEGAQRSSDSRFNRIAAAALPLAACVVLWFGLSGPVDQIGSGKDLVSNENFTPSLTTENKPSIDDVTIRFAEGKSKCDDFSMFDRCFTGPGSIASADSLTSECSCVDLDRDGDVDFADFARFQRSFGSPQNAL